MIEVQGLIKRFKQLDVLRGVNMRVRRGDVAVLVGPSGSGKSTLLRCMNLLEEPEKGRVLFEGRDITAPGVDVDAVRQKIGMVFQQFNLFANMTVLDNVAAGPVCMQKGSLKKKRASARSSCWPVLAFLKRRAHTQHSFPAASSSAWPLRALWPCSRT